MADENDQSPKSAEDRLRERLENREEAEQTSGQVQELPVNQETLDPYGFMRGQQFDAAEYDQFNSQYTSTLTRRAMRWSGINFNRRSRRLKRFIRKGVPSSLRREVWMTVSGAGKLLSGSPGVYAELKNPEKAPDDLLKPIDLDIHRTLTNNVHFRGAVGGDNSLASLRSVLIAVGRHYPSINYCQGLNFIAAYLLLIVGDDEEVFWLMVALLDSLPDYYGTKLHGMQIDCYVLQQLVREKLPRLHDHLLAHNCSVDLFATKWFITLFLDCLPQETGFRVLDCLFYEGSKVLFRISLAILAHEEERLLGFKDIGELLMFMKSIMDQTWLLYCHEFIELAFQRTQPLSSAAIARLRQRATEDRLLKIT